MQQRTLAGPIFRLMPTAYPYWPALADMYNIVLSGMISRHSSHRILLSLSRPIYSISTRFALSAITWPPCPRFLQTSPACTCHFIRDPFSCGIGLTSCPRAAPLVCLLPLTLSASAPTLCLSFSFLDFFGTGACSAFC
jgi:hypothetical protein